MEAVGDGPVGGDCTKTDVSRIDCIIEGNADACVGGGGVQETDLAEGGGAAGISRAGAAARAGIAAGAAAGHASSAAGAGGEPREYRPDGGAAGIAAGIAAGAAGTGTAAGAAAGRIASRPYRRAAFRSDRMGQTVVIVGAAAGCAAAGPDGGTAGRRYGGGETLTGIGTAAGGRAGKDRKTAFRSYRRGQAVVAFRGGADHGIIGHAGVHPRVGSADRRHRHGVFAGHGGYARTVRG